MPQLMDFAGQWRIARVIEDRLAGSGVFEGTGQFVPEGTGLRYTEEGWLRLGEGTPMKAERAYLWRVAEDGLIETRFEDGRDFHTFDGRAERPEDRHYCDPDIYDVIYDFRDWPRWSSKWTVTGPRKDYVMLSEFRPA